MKKITNISIGGRLFIIEDDAYKVLSEYLETVSGRLADVPDSAEIISDIEHAIADKFLMHQGGQSTVTKAHVDAVISEMGTAAQVAGEDYTSSADTHEDTVERRLYRDVDNGILGGVAAGLSQYSSIDPVIIRLAFIVLAFFDGIGVLVYALLWLVTPAAKTTTQKYAMRGEGATISHIIERFETATESMEGSKGVWKKVRNVLSKLFQVAGVVVKKIVSWMYYIVGGVLILAGTVGIALLAGVAGAIWTSGGVYENGYFAALHQAILSEPSGSLFFIALVIFALVPVMIALMAGLSVLRKHNLFTLGKSIVLLLVWGAATAILISLLFLHGERVAHTLQENAPDLFGEIHIEEY